MITGKINIGNLIDVTMQTNDAIYDSRKSTAVYLKKHECSYVWLGGNLDHDYERLHIKYACENKDKMTDCLWNVCYILDLDEGQKLRLYSATRAMKRWYDKETHWEKLPSRELLDRIRKYIFG